MQFYFTVYYCTQAWLESSEAKLKMNLIYLLPADHQAGDNFAGLIKIYRH